MFAVVAVVSGVATPMVPQQYHAHIVSLINQCHSEQNEPRAAWCEQSKY